MRGVDILLSFPTLLIYILIITSIGSSAIIVVIAISLGSVPPITRIVRSLTLDERTKDYVNAARLRGERRRYILLREILPNVSGPIIVDSCIRVGVRDHGDRLELGFLGNIKNAVGHTATHPRLGRDDQRGDAEMDLQHAVDAGNPVGYAIMAIALGFLGSGPPTAALSSARSSSGSTCWLTGSGKSGNSARRLCAW